MIDPQRDYNQEHADELRAKFEAATSADNEAKPASRAGEPYHGLVPPGHDFDRPLLAEAAKQASSAGEVPEWARLRADEFYGQQDLYGGASRWWRDTFARYIAAHEPEPIDPLDVAVKAALDAVEGKYLWTAETLTAELRQRGVTAPDGGA